MPVRRGNICIASSMTHKPDTLMLRGMVPKPGLEPTYSVATSSISCQQLLHLPSWPWYEPRSAYHLTKMPKSVQLNNSWNMSRTKKHVHRKTCSEDNWRPAAAECLPFSVAFFSALDRHTTISKRARCWAMFGAFAPMKTGLIGSRTATSFVADRDICTLQTV